MCQWLGLSYGVPIADALDGLTQDYIDSNVSPLNGLVLDYDTSIDNTADFY